MPYNPQYWITESLIVLSWALLRSRTHSPPAPLRNMLLIVMPVMSRDCSDEPMYTSRPSSTRSWMLCFQVSIARRSVENGTLASCSCPSMVKPSSVIQLWSMLKILPVPYSTAW